MEIFYKLKKQYIITFAILIIASFFAPSADRPDYFNFADQNELFSIPHFLDVITNGIFFISGIIGVYCLKKFKHCFNPLELKSYGLFSFGSILLTFGSGYFHWSPNPETLIWDRIPMIICFSSLITFIISDRTNLNNFEKIMYLFLSIGILTTFGVAYLYQSLRPYYLFQLGTILFTFILTVSLKQNKISNFSLYSMFFLYLLAKFSESMDHQIYELLKIISGHNLKHLLAGFGMIILNINLLNKFKVINPSFQVNE